METVVKKWWDENDYNTKFSMACASWISLYLWIGNNAQLYTCIMGTKKMNGKETETPKESFEKYTGHIFLKQLKLYKEILNDYVTEQKDKNYLFWQRYPLAILIRDRKMVTEKIDYIHYNPSTTLEIEWWSSWI